MDKIDFPSNSFEEYLIDSVKGFDDKTLVYVDGEDLRTAAAAKRFLSFMIRS